MPKSAFARKARQVQCFELAEAAAPHTWLPVAGNTPIPGDLLARHAPTAQRLDLVEQRARDHAGASRAFCWMRQSHNGRVRLAWLLLIVMCWGFQQPSLKQG